MRILTAVCTGLLLSAALSSSGIAQRESPPALTPDELAYLTQRLARDGNDQPLDRRVIDALGLTQEGGAPLALRALGIVDPSRGDGYFFAPLPDGRMLLGRREWTGRIFYWLVALPGSAPGRGVLVVAEGTAPLAEDQAEAEERRIVAFLRSNIPAQRPRN